MKNVLLLATKAADQYLGDRKINSRDIECVENKLCIIFSDDFKKIYNIIPYDLLGSSMSYNFPTGVVEETLRLRRDLALPLDTVFLSEESESIYFMKCFGDHEEVYWLSNGDAYNYCEEKPLEDNPIIFPTFTDFFEYLVTEEEKARGIYAG